MLGFLWYSVRIGYNNKLSNLVYCTIVLRLIGLSFRAPLGPESWRASGNGTGSRNWQCPTAACLQPIRWRIAHKLVSFLWSRRLVATVPSMMVLFSFIWSPACGTPGNGSRKPSSASSMQLPYSTLYDESHFERLMVECGAMSLHVLIVTICAPSTYTKGRRMDGTIHQALHVWVACFQH
jgi:hypothetical protein